MEFSVAEVLIFVELCCYSELIVHSWSWWLLAGKERLVDKLIWNKFASSISNRVSWLLSAVVYSDRRCNFHICYCQAKWSSKWLSCKNRMTKTLCNYWTKQIGLVVRTGMRWWMVLERKVQMQLHEQGANFHLILTNYQLKWFCEKPTSLFRKINVVQCSSVALR